MFKNQFTFLSCLIIFFLSSQTLFAQPSSDKSWISQRKPLNSFIENQGQFVSRNTTFGNSEILYGYDGSNQDFYFTKEGVIIELTQQQKRVKSAEEKKLRAEKKQQGFKDANDFRAFEEEGHRMDIKKDEIFVKWLGSNPNVKIIVENKDVYYHNYSFYDLNGKLASKNHINSYQKITYINLYNNIDVVYEIHPETGYKYSVILHPGANPSEIKLQYSKNIKDNSDGTISIQTDFGDIIDHSPLTFYADNHQNTISSYYEIINNTIGFKLANYNSKKTVVIDPWTQTPNFPSTDWDCIWECERDGAGNVYVIGGTSPLQLLKYNSTGTLQWTYNTTYDTTEWLGTFATDDAGNSYVANGSPARIMKINTAGVQVWSNNNPGGLLGNTEFWNITFNCDQTRLLIGGTDGVLLNILPYLFEVNMNTGNLITSVQVTGGAGIPNTQEVRSITPCNNGKYYFLTHDSIGYIHQSLTSCTSNNGIFKVNNGIDLGYKCENWRYNNSGIMALAHYNGFVFVHRGNQIQKRNFATAAIVATATIPGGVFNSGFGGNSVGCSGIDIDNCGNIFVGSTNGVYKFDQNLTQLTSFATTFNVYDVEVNSNGEVIAGGSTGNSGSGARSGFIQSFAAAACAPQSIVCCDATICRPNSLCVSDAPVTIQSTSSGGTFSASCGTCINATTGVFNPTVSGVGTFTVTYTLACGSESVDVVVNSCAAVSVCQQSPTVLAASGGTSYTWYAWNPGGSTPITTQAQCTACGYTWTFGQCLNGIFPVTSCNVPAGYQLYGTGTTVTTPSNFPIQVVSSSGTTVTYNSLSNISACATGCPTITITPLVINTTCGLNNGSVNVTASGGSTPYTYSWSNGITTQSNTGLAAGNYTVTVRDLNNCTATATVSVSGSSAVSITFTTTNASCGGNNGSINITASGGTAPYSFVWSNGSTTEDISGLPPGTYTPTCSDGNGCTVSTSITITSSAGLSISPNPTNVTCNGLSNGIAAVNVSGGSGTLSYSWSTGATTAAVSGLAAGIYNVTVNSGTGSAADTVYRQDFSGVHNWTLNVSTGANGADNNFWTVNANEGGVLPPGCGVANNGNNTLHVTSVFNPTGGAAYDAGGLCGLLFCPLTNRRAESPVFSTVGRSNLTLSFNFISLGDGLLDNASVFYNSGSGWTQLVNSIKTTTCGGGQGQWTNFTIALPASCNNNPTVQIGFNWTNNDDGVGSDPSVAIDNILVTSPGAGSVCSGTQSVTITQPSAITVTSTTSNPSCSSSNGSVNITVSGGTSPYSYSWNNGSSLEDISGLASGTYTVTVTDFNNCTFSSTSSISAASGITLTNTSSNTNCSANNGTINLTVSGGTTPYTYNWSNGSTTQDIIGLSANTYTVKILYLMRDKIRLYITH